TPSTRSWQGGLQDVATDGQSCATEVGSLALTTRRRPPSHRSPHGDHVPLRPGGPVDPALREDARETGDPRDGARNAGARTMWSHGQRHHPLLRVLAEGEPNHELLPAGPQDALRGEPEV